MQTSSTLILMQFTICCTGINFDRCLAGGGEGVWGWGGGVEGKALDVSAGIFLDKSKLN